MKPTHENEKGTHETELPHQSTNHRLLEFRVAWLLFFPNHKLHYYLGINHGINKVSRQLITWHAHGHTSDSQFFSQPLRHLFNKLLSYSSLLISKNWMGIYSSYKKSFTFRIRMLICFHAWVTRYFCQRTTWKNNILKTNIVFFISTRDW